MRILVTGGAGFIGSNIVEELLKRGHSVRVIDNFLTGKRSNLYDFADNIELIEGDIRSYHVVNKAVKNIDVIIHQAALPSVPRSFQDPITVNDINVGGTLNLLDAAVKNNVRRIVFASSSSIYGDNEVLPKHELLVPDPLSPYACSKISAEHYCRVFSYKIETIALRYFNVFGPRQDPGSQYSAVIPKFIKIMINNGKPVIFGDGTQSRDFTYVSNVVEANILAATCNYNEPLILNCATGGSITINELVKHINLILGKNITPNYSGKRVGEIQHSFADISRIREKLNYQPKVDFLNGLNRTVNYYYERSEKKINELSV